MSLVNTANKSYLSDHIIAFTIGVSMFFRIFFAIYFFLGCLNLSYAMNGDIMSYTYETLADEEQEEIYEKYIELIIFIHDFKMRAAPSILELMRKSKDFLLWFMDSGCALSQEKIKDLGFIMNIITKDSTNSSSDDA